MSLPVRCSPPPGPSSRNVNALSHERNVLKSNSHSELKCKSARSSIWCHVCPRIFFGIDVGRCNFIIDGMGQMEINPKIAQSRRMWEKIQGGRLLFLPVALSYCWLAQGEGLSTA